MKKPAIPKFIIGQEYLTRGGWKAMCIWTTDEGGWFIHKPDSEGESNPTFHKRDGSAHEIFTIAPLPVYNGHPADIVDIWREERPVNDDEDDEEIPEGG